MARVKEYREVINNSDREYKEEFKGDVLVFPPHGSMVMERRDSVQFLAQYKPFDREKSNGDKPLSWRPAPEGAKLTVAAKTPEAPEPKFVNPVTGAQHATKESLDEELKGFEHLKLREKED